MRHKNAKILERIHASDAKRIVLLEGLLSTVGNSSKCSDGLFLYNDVPDGCEVDGKKKKRNEIKNDRKKRRKNNKERQKKEKK